MERTSWCSKGCSFGTRFVTFLQSNLYLSMLFPVLLTQFYATTSEYKIQERILRVSIHLIILKLRGVWQTILDSDSPSHLAQTVRILTKLHLQVKQASRARSPTSNLTSFNRFPWEQLPGDSLCGVQTKEKHPGLGREHGSGPQQWHGCSGGTAAVWRLSHKSRECSQFLFRYCWEDIYTWSSGINWTGSWKRKIRKIRK